MKDNVKVLSLHNPLFARGGGGCVPSALPAAGIPAVIMGEFLDSWLDCLL